MKTGPEPDEEGSGVESADGTNKNLPLLDNYLRENDASNGSKGSPYKGNIRMDKKESEKSGYRTGGRAREVVESGAPAGQPKTCHSPTIVSEETTPATLPTDPACESEF